MLSIDFDSKRLMVVLALVDRHLPHKVLGVIFSSKTVSSNQPIDFGGRVHKYPEGVSLDSESYV